MTDILPRDLLLYAGGDAWKRFGTFTRRTHRIQRGGEGQQETIARADSTTCATYFGLDGLIHTAAANVMRPHWIDTDGDGIVDTLTALLEGAATNIALWCRDLTNGAWAKSSTTAAKNQTGIDGAANSASSLTASAGNGTCLQVVTLASSSRAQSCYIKRLVGSGVIQMTTDGGTTWTAVTVTATWARVSIPSQTLANPSFGFRIATNGDSVAIDFVQNETGAYPTSAIATTTGAVTRAADTCTIPIGFTPPAVGAGLTVYFKVYPEWPVGLADGVGPGILGLGCDTGGIAADGTVLVDFFHATGGNGLQNRLIANGAIAQTSPAYTQASPIEGVLQIVPVAANHQLTIVLSDGTTATTTAATIAGLPWRQLQLELGNRANGAQPGNSAYQRVMVINGVHSLAECQAVP